MIILLTINTILITINIILITNTTTTFKVHDDLGQLDCAKSPTTLSREGAAAGFFQPSDPAGKLREAPFPQIYHETLKVPVKVCQSMIDLIPTSSLTVWSLSGYIFKP